MVDMQEIRDMGIGMTMRTIIALHKNTLKTGKELLDGKEFEEFEYEKLKLLSKNIETILTTPKKEDEEEK